MKTFKILIAASLLAFASIASAVTVQPPLSIDFGTGIGQSGTITDIGNNDIHGVDIFIGAMNIDNAVNSAANGGYTANAFLNFDTSANTMSVEGTVGGADPALSTTQVLFSGTIDSFTYTPGTIEVFSATGAGSISEGLANFVGVSQFQAFEYVEFSLSMNNNALSTDILLTPETRTPEVPVPAAAWLFGSGLLGLVGIARRTPKV